MPLCFGASGSVRTATQLWVAMCAMVFHIFWPLIDPLVAVEHGARAQRRHVGAGLGLGVGDGEVDLGGDDARQPLLLLLLAADAHDRRRDRGHGQRQHRRAGALELVDEDPLLDRRAPEAAVLRRPGDAPAAAVAQLEDELRRASGPLPSLPASRSSSSSAGVRCSRDERAHLVAPGALLGREVVAHGGCCCRFRWRVQARRRTERTAGRREASAGLCGDSMMLGPSSRRCPPANPSASTSPRTTSSSPPPTSSPTPAFASGCMGTTTGCRIAVDGQLGPQGYVVDFGVVKRIARRLCERLDERLLIPAHSDCLEHPREEATRSSCATSTTSSAFRAPTSCCSPSCTPRSRSWRSTSPASCGASSTPKASARSTAIEVGVEESFGQTRDLPAGGLRACAGRGLVASGRARADRQSAATPACRIPTPPAPASTPRAAAGAIASTPPAA